MASGLYFRLTALLPLLVSGAVQASEVVWSEGFEQGLDGVALYFADDPRDLLTLSTEGPAEGSQSVKMLLPGDRALEGLQLMAEVPSHRLVTVRAKVKGTGKLLFCLMSATGWVYAQPVALSGKWREVTLSKTLGVNDVRLRICFLGSGKQSGAEIEVDGVEVAVEPELMLQETNVEPSRYDAAAFGPKAAVRQATEGALAREVLGGGGRFQLNGLPFPQTTLPVSVYLRLSGAVSGSRIELKSVRGGTLHTIRTVSPEELGGWQWVEIPNVTAEEVGEVFYLGVTPAQEGAEVWADCVVLSTRQGLEEGDLAKATGYGAL